MILDGMLERLGFSNGESKSKESISSLVLETLKSGRIILNSI